MPTASNNGQPDAIRERSTACTARSGAGVSLMDRQEYVGSGPFHAWHYVTFCNLSLYPGVPSTMTQPMMTATTLPSVFSPLAKILLDSFQEGVVVFDAQGRILI